MTLFVASSIGEDKRSLGAGRSHLADEVQVQLAGGPLPFLARRNFRPEFSRTGRRLLGQVERAAKTSPGPAWHSEFKGDIPGEKFPLDRLGRKEYFLAGCYPSDSLVNPSTSPSTFRSFV